MSRCEEASAFEVLIKNFPLHLLLLCLVWVGGHLLDFTTENGDSCHACVLSRIPARRRVHHNMTGKTYTRFHFPRLSWWTLTILPNMQSLKKSQSFQLSHFFLGVAVSLWIRGRLIDYIFYESTQCCLILKTKKEVWVHSIILVGLQDMIDRKWKPMANILSLCF